MLTIIPCSVVAPNGHTGIRIESFEGQQEDFNTDSLALAFRARMTPGAEFARLVVRLHPEANRPEHWGFRSLSALSPEEAVPQIALAAVAVHLADAPRVESTQHVVTCGGTCLLELAKRTRASDEEILEYLKARLFWAWKYDLTTSRAEWYDSVVLGVSGETIDRVSLIAQGDLLKRTVYSTGAISYEPRAKLLREFPGSLGAGLSTDAFQTAFNTYTKGRKIGDGGSGWVYEARDSHGELWAVKVLDPARATPERLKRFKNEHLFSSRNQHPNIITMVDHGIATVRGTATSFLVMPRFDCSLRDLMREGIKPEQVVGYFSQILEGIKEAHDRGVVHRDLKPENVLYLTRSDRLVVADFGIAHFAQEDLFTAVETGSHERLANFQYAAPEQRIRGGEVSLAADIYALGLMLNELFTGQVPHGTDYTTIESVAPELAYLDGLVAQMIRQNPEARPPVAQVRSMLESSQTAAPQGKTLEQRARQVQAKGPMVAPDVRVKFLIGLAPGLPGEVETYLTVSIANHDTVSVFLQNVYVEAEGSKRFIPQVDALTREGQKKRELRAGDNFDFNLSAAAVVSQLRGKRPLNAGVIDAIGRDFHGDAEEFRKAFAAALERADSQ